MEHIKLMCMAITLFVMVAVSSSVVWARGGHGGGHGGGHYGGSFWGPGYYGGYGYGNPFFYPPYYVTHTRS